MQHLYIKGPAHSIWNSESLAAFSLKPRQKQRNVVIIVLTQHYTEGPSKCRRARKRKKRSKELEKKKKNISASHIDNIKYIKQYRKKYEKYLKIFSVIAGYRAVY